LQDKDQKTLNDKYNGVHGLAAALGSDKKHGLQEDSVEASRSKYGPNAYKQVPPKSFFAILYEGFKDPVILLLCAAATVSNRHYSCTACRHLGPDTACALLHAPQLHAAPLVSICKHGCALDTP
jgi:hypothetical protein